MKILVDKIPESCADCPYHAPAMMMTQLGVQKEIMLCTIQTSLIPPAEPTQEPNVLDIKLSPKENNCPCKELGDNTTDYEINSVSNLILQS